MNRTTIKVEQLEVGDQVYIQNETLQLDTVTRDKEEEVVIFCGYNMGGEPRVWKLDYGTDIEITARRDD